MSALTRKLLRSIRTTYRQFIALAAMVMAGVALFVAFNTSLTNLISSQENYYQEYGPTRVFLTCSCGGKALALS